VNQQKNSERYNSKESPIIPPQPYNKSGKKTLILDLDETLVHTSFSNDNADYILNVKS